LYYRAVATVTVILGLCGSGKSHYLKNMSNVEPFEEGAWPDNRKEWKRFLDTLAMGKDCGVIEIAYITEDGRDELVRLVGGRYPDTNFEWICFKNDLATANWNCLNDPERPRDRAEGNVAQNNCWTHQYTIPKGAVVHDIFKIPPLKR
jgi:hypothetical protein